MLHARQPHLDNLPTLLDWLIDGEYTPITYRTLWQSLTEGKRLPARPVIVSIDDLTLVRGSSNFWFIEKMVNVCLERELPVVLAVITEPVVPGASGQLIRVTKQDDGLWDTACTWIEAGVELATHTATHLDLASATLDDCCAEVEGSAHLISERTGLPVGTLVLPFGNGAANSQECTLLPQIITACQQAGIGIAAGIAGGRKPLVCRTADEQPVYFVGRVGPLAASFGSIYYDIERW